VVVAEAARAAGMSPVGFVDDDREPPLAGVLDRLGGLASIERGQLLERHRAILGLGDLGFRRRLIPVLADAIAAVVHPSAWISPTATIEPGAFIGPMAVVHAEAHIRQHAIINSAAVVEHHCTIGENAHIAPGAVLGGDVAVGADTLVGLGAQAIPGVRIGDRCTVGAGSAVIQDLPHDATAVGVPARALEQ